MVDTLAFASVASYLYESAPTSALVSAAAGIAAVSFVWSFWSKLYFSKSIPTQPNADLTYALVLRRRLRMGYAGLIEWYA